MSCRLGGLEPDDLQRMWSTQTMPMQLLLGQEGEVSYRHAAFMAPYPGEDWDGVAWTGRSAGVVEICANGQGTARVELEWRHDDGAELVTSQVDNGIAVTAEGRRQLWVRCSRGALEAHESGASWTVDPEGDAVFLEVFVPDPESQPEDMGRWVVSDLHREAMGCWERFLGTGAKLSLPDELLDAIVAMSRVHCAAAARHEAGGRRIAPWIASISYGPLESESHSVILGMDGMGHEEFGRRGLDFFIGRYNPHGFLTTGYTTMGTGWHLWTLGEHVLLHGDTDWLGERSAEVARACRWVMRERRKTGGRLPSGDPVPERGLMPPSVIADWNVFEYRWFQQASYCAGLDLVGEALSRCGHPAARAVLLDAAELRREILRAYDWAQARTPAVELRSGEWVPGSPGMLRAFGPIHDAYPGEDHQRSWAGDAELGPNHLVPLGVLKPGDRRTDWLVDQLEDNLCLRTGMGDYDEESNRADWFGRGGFCKLQPYYGRLAEVHALRDDRKAFLRSYLNAIPSLVSRELMSFWEHFANMGAWNKTHETGWFLWQTRTMLVQERGDDLWLAPFIPAEWLRGGEPLVVEDLPTRFGPVSYRMEPDGKGDMVAITIRPPRRRDPAALILRLAHPEDRDITGLSIDDAPQPVPPDGLVRLPAACAEVRAMVHYS
ncbi:MAG: hypothetical protein GF320_04925 [Armatimonadia bacterium]|nr:hypothetical protein [Armatimonadia bacterium]